MRILLDECVPAKLKTCFPGHQVQTVADAGWRGSKDRALLEFAERNFDVFLTIDGKIEHQHDLKSMKLGFVIARVRSNRFIDFQPLRDGLMAAVGRARPGRVVHVPEKSL